MQRHALLLPGWRAGLPDSGSLKVSRCQALVSILTGVSLCARDYYAHVAAFDDAEACSLLWPVAGQAGKAPAQISARFWPAGRDVFSGRMRPFWRLYTLEGPNLANAAYFGRRQPAKKSHTPNKRKVDAASLGRTQT